MVQGLMLFLLGLFLGMVIVTLTVQRGTPFGKKWRAKVHPWMRPVLLIGGASYLVVRNASLFLNPKPQTTFSGLETAFLMIPANDVVLMLGGYVALVGAFSFVIRIPFSNWQQIKILGLFEATRIKEEAKEEIKANRELEFNRLVRLNVLTNHDKGYKTVLENITVHGEVVVDSLLSALLESITNTYYEGSEKFVVSGGFANQADIIMEAPEMVKNLWMEVRHDMRKAHRFSNGWESIIFCALDIGGRTFIIWLRSGEYSFDEIDEAFLLSIRNSIEHYVALAVVDRTVIV